MDRSLYFSHSRTPDLSDLSSNACYEAWVAYRAAHDDGIDLSVSNPTVCGLPQIDPDVEALRAAISAHYTASSQGLIVAREAVAAYYGGRANPDAIQLFASTSEAVGALLKLLCAPGDSVVTCTPTYPLLDCLTSLEGVELRETSLQDCAGEWMIDFWALEQVCDSTTRAIIVVSPNNPTGHCIRFDEMAKLVEFCASRSMALIVDEVFGGYRLRDDGELMPEAASTYFNAAGCGLVVSLSGLSKVCGLPQHKLGWGVFGGDPGVVSEAMQRMSYITDSTLSVSGWVQRLAPSLLARRGEFSLPCLERCRTNLAIIREMSNKIGVKWRLDRVDGGWSACLRLPGWCDDESIATRIAESGVRVFPGSFFGYRDRQPTLVVSLIVEHDTMRKGMERVMQVIDVEV